uniref:MIT domain-containing protein n=1 Tax=Pyrodinium bahamense TaxID=73915 RepID=A0A7S0FIQ9_9DINO|eukprot:CAMPEP_0179070826 /NCGR_PEP_ID=MMETSP0796-20121207/31219_1 /TAXON_ID=73915 /ORGANISM="Pyrodinium bahamense, Strain pbaha01" /LENGTH=274 /DNA_ID=CAMNT_0020767927 /DNA_START=42 /DNA_END=866 /DNA_ORIENTATION=+
MASNDVGQDPCTQRVLAASVAENEAISLDRAGNVAAAIQRYEECERELSGAIGLALPAHADDHPKLVQHRKEILDRIAHLKSLNGAAPTIPVEQQINAVQLGMQATGAASSAVSSAGGAKTLAACAALGAVGGFVVLGGTVGAGLSIVGGAAGAAYVATRQDKLGDAARTAGSCAIAGVEKAKKLNDEHKVTAKIADAGSKAVTAAKTVDEKYKISDKVSHGVGTILSKAQEIEQKHQVTDKVASGISKGFGKLSSALEGASKKSSGTASSTAQ